MPLDDASKDWLRARFGDRVRFDEPMSRHTSLRVGGPAEAFVTPTDADELAALVVGARRRGLACLVVGGGTNLLVLDRGIRGIVAALGGALTSISAETAHRGQVRVTAMAGARMAALCAFALRQGLAGLNFAVGIPGTVGGAIAMNAGTPDGCIGDVLEGLRVLLPSGAERHLDRRELAFGYRSLDLNGLSDPATGAAAVIIAGRFALASGDAAAIRAQAAAVMQRRKARQPYDRPSAGCFFKNPPGGMSAGEIIERAGLKGKRIGGAVVSERHANFILNAGGASAEDFLQMMALVRQTVAERFDIVLEPEVRTVGS